MEGDLTRHKDTAAARIAVTAVAAVPADAGTLTSFPADHPVADRVNDAGYFMSRDPRVLDARPHSLLGQGIAVADAASLNLYPHLPRAGVRYLAFNDLERSAG